MADFRDQRAPQVSPQVTVKQGVQDNSTATFLSGLADGAKTLFDGIKSAKESEKATNANKALVDYQTQLLKLADGVDQKIFSAADGRSRSRALLNQFSANNPALAAEARKLHSKILSSAGLGKVIGRDSGIEVAQRALEQDAFKAGFITESMSQEERQVGVINYQNYQRSIQAISDEAKRVGLDNAKLTRDKSIIALRNSRNKEQAEKLLDSVFDGSREQIANTIDTFRAQIRGGKSRDEVLRDLAIAKSYWEGEVNKLARSAGNEQIKAVMGPVFRLFDIAEQEFNGQLTEDVAKRQLSIIQTGIKVQMLNDPDYQKLYAASSILPNSDISTIMEARQYVTNLLKQNTFKRDDGTLKTPANLWDQNDPNQLKTHKALSGILKKNMRHSLSGKNKDPALNEHIQNNLVNVLRATDVYKDIINEPKKLNEVYELIASPEFGQWAAINKLPEDVLTQALNVYRDRYEREALPAIEKLWANPEEMAQSRADVINRAKTGEPAKHGVVAQMTESGVVFSAPDAGDQFDQTMKNIFNRDLGPVVNRLIRATAHLQGHQNYKQVYDEHFKRIFEPDAVEGKEGLGKPEIEEEEEEQEIDPIGEFLIQDQSKISPLIQPVEPTDFGNAKTVFDIIGITEGTDKARGYNETLAYGAYTGGPVNLTGMSLNEVMSLQNEMLQHPDNKFNSSAVGRYQIVGKTLRGLVKKLGLSGNEKFDEQMQDTLARELLKQRGFDKWGAGKITTAEFINNISKEWASLPNMGGSGTYAGQRAAISVGALQGLLDSLKG